AEDGIRDRNVTGVQTCTLPILDDIDRELEGSGIPLSVTVSTAFGCPFDGEVEPEQVAEVVRRVADTSATEVALADTIGVGVPGQIGRASCREGGRMEVGNGLVI